RGLTGQIRISQRPAEGSDSNFRTPAARTSRPGVVDSDPGFGFVLTPGDDDASRPGPLDLEDAGAGAGGPGAGGGPAQPAAAQAGRGRQWLGRSAGAGAGRRGLGADHPRPGAAVHQDVTTRVNPLETVQVE